MQFDVRKNLNAHQINNKLIIARFNNKTEDKSEQSINYVAYWNLLSIHIKMYIPFSLWNYFQYLQRCYFLQFQILEGTND